MCTRQGCLHRAGGEVCTRQGCLHRAGGLQGFLFNGSQHQTAAASYKVSIVETLDKVDVFFHNDDHNQLQNVLHFPSAILTYSVILYFIYNILYCTSKLSFIEDIALSLTDHSVFDCTLPLSSSPSTPQSWSCCNAVHWEESC